MRNLIIAAAMVCAPAALIAQDMGHDDMDHGDMAMMGKMTAQQQAMYDAWPIERRTSFDAWPNDYRTYYWTLQPDQQTAYWVLTDDQRAMVAKMTPEQRNAAWQQVMAQYKAAAPSTGNRVEHPGMAGTTPAGNPASSMGHAKAGPMMSSTAPAPATLPYCSAAVTDNCMQKNEAPRGYKPAK